jgi:hypothetical protein
MAIPASTLLLTSLNVCLPSSWKSAVLISVQGSKVSLPRTVSGEYESEKRFPSLKSTSLRNLAMVTYCPRILYDGEPLNFRACSKRKPQHRNYQHPLTRTPMGQPIHDELHHHLGRHTADCPIVQCAYSRSRSRWRRSVMEDVVNHVIAPPRWQNGSDSRTMRCQTSIAGHYRPLRYGPRKETQTRSRGNESRLARAHRGSVVSPEWSR